MDPWPAPDCSRCHAFHVTYDLARPYGCRTFGFKSALLPAHEVRLTTGQECAAFEPRPLKAGERPRGSPGAD
jgi:hypothetical protein